LPVFIFLVFLIAALLWVLLSFAFIPIGKLVSRIWGDAKDAMQKEDPEPEDTENQINEKR
jgi:hypothetical protein